MGLRLLCVLVCLQGSFHGILVSVTVGVLFFYGGYVHHDGQGYLSCCEVEYFLCGATPHNSSMTTFINSSSTYVKASDPVNT